MLSFAAEKESTSVTIQQKLAKLEASSDGRLGILAVNTANNQYIEYRSRELFPYQSTFKVLVVSAILKQSMGDSHLLQKKLSYKKQDLVYWSPITKQHVAQGMTISELCAASLMYSDNTATNLLVKQLGGLEGVTHFVHAIGNNIFRLDNWEPDLNGNPRDSRDTSTPEAMEDSLQKVTLGNVLSPSRREQLVTWMKGNTTGDGRIRAGTPKGWAVADKTGGGLDYGITNDIGIIWPPKCSPIVVTMFFVENKKDGPRREDIIASATRLLIQEFSNTDQCIKESFLH